MIDRHTLVNTDTPFGDISPTRVATKNSVKLDY